MERWKMGADIHLWVEKNTNGKWNITKGMDVADLEWYQSMLDENKEKGINSDYNYLSEEYLLERIEEAKKPVDEWLYNGRNYNLFAILADVRNGRGFAGVKTGEGYNPISMPKGVPDDASDTYQNQVEDWNGDGHSHSYFTLKELKVYDWDQTTVSYGVVSERYYKEIKETGESPTSYSGGISGKNIEVVNEEVMDGILSGTIERFEGIEYYVRMRWGVTYKEEAGLFYTDSIKALEELSESENQDDVRIVFFFDN
jgi:hypothetical protein